MLLDEVKPGFWERGKVGRDDKKMRHKTWKSQRKNRA